MEIGAIPVNEPIKEYFRLGRVFNAEIISVILVLSYLISSYLYSFEYNIWIILALFFAGLCAHVGGSYNNDRMDLSIDENAKYCAHKPLVTGKISIASAKKIEFISMAMFSILVFLCSLYTAIQSTDQNWFLRPIITIGYIAGGIFLAFGYNRWNKSNMFVNVVGQFYAGFVVLMGMSVVTIFDPIVGIIALIIGLNGVYLNIIEADIKDISGDIVNVPKSLGVQIKNGKARHIWKFYLVNDLIKITMFILLIYVLLELGLDNAIIVIGVVFFIVNYAVRILLFRNLGKDREQLKKIIALQELTAILMISTVFMVVNVWIPVFLVVFVLVWLMIWNKMLWGTYLRPQV